MTAMICVVCQKRETDCPQVCPACRRGLDDDLRALIGATADVEAEVAAPMRSSAGAAPVSGSREAPVPVSLDAVDLTLPARAAKVTDPCRDQIGLLSVASVLDSWVREWISYSWCLGDHLPVPTVVTLVGWLSVRLEDACDYHPAIDDFAREVRVTLRACRRVTGDVEARPEYLDGVPCAGCDLIALARHPGSDYRAECGSCGKLYTDDEYERWCRLLAGAQVRAA